MLNVAYVGNDFFSFILSALIDRADVRVVACVADGPAGQPAENVARLAGEIGVTVITGG